MSRLPKWVTFGRISHKTSQHKGPVCANVKTGDDTVRSWKKTNCPACLAWREEHKNDRIKRFYKRKAAAAGDSDP